jgi:hypothetical protein
MKTVAFGMATIYALLALLHSVTGKVDMTGYRSPTSHADFQGTRNYVGIEFSESRDVHILHLRTTLPVDVRVNEEIRFELESGVFVEGSVAAVTGNGRSDMIISGSLVEGTH